MMVDWRGSSLQIVVALIGSSLILTALTSLSTFFSKPSLDISAEVDYPFSDTNTTYRIFLVNNGYSAAKDVRFTMTYPDAKVINAAMIYQNENFTLTKTIDSVVAFSSRLSPGVKIGIVNNITGTPYFSERFKVDRLRDFDTDNSNNYYQHTQPFTISVTHDEGGNTYRPIFRESADPVKVYFNVDALKFFIPIVVGILLVGIAHRHKRKSLSKFASNVLKDIEAAKEHFKEANSKAIVSFKNYDFNIGNELEVFDNYEYYKLINDFYKGLKERESKILDPTLSSNLDDVVKEQNSKCYTQAMHAHDKIVWKKFYKLDLILLLPSIILGSYFVTLVGEGVTTLLFFRFNFIDFEYFTEALIISTFIARTIGTFFIIRLIVRTVQGRNIVIHLFPWLLRKRTFLILSAVIMGFPSLYLITISVYSFQQVPDPAQYDYGLQRQIIEDNSTMIVLLIDIGRMLLLTLVVSRYPRIRKNNGQDRQNDEELWKKA